MTFPPTSLTALRGRLAPGLAAGAVLLLTVGACGGPDTLQGTVVSAAAAGKAGTPLDGGRLAVLDDGGLRDFLGAAGIDTPPQAELAYLGGRVRHDDVTRAGGSLVTIDDKGEFTLTTTGRRTICLLLETPQVDVLRGCVALELPASGHLRITVAKDELKAALED
ncbi:hypothetical protein ASD62_09830 [Phycicoccus sp. Root563]|uniref:hypothetical protein n=1 Tax=unclassified Phycicoccus TaxID=2637926 RepID=UPI0007032634|nr:MULTISPECIES: hypothetical protein [unclassified Phycicoccus]KQU65314.1 hypothetical protein ASC58_17640 [Phycicoccus sp. Root101]KQZ89559.1 hypothetical protein ASD62_09830 [Phycicoccus sp. Root563]